MAGIELPGAWAVFKAVLYKESVKARLGWCLLALANMAFMAWLLVVIRRLFRLDHAEIVWYRVIGLEQIPYEPLRFIPLLTGVIFACLQFLPEMRDERLRLSLHLPASSNTVILAHLAAGLCCLSVIYALDATLLASFMRYWFPVETSYVAVFTVLPWLLAGATAYLGVTLALLEPGLKLRLFQLALTGGLAGMLLWEFPPGARAGSLPLLALAPLLLLPASLLPARHFRHRRVDS